MESQVCGVLFALNIVDINSSGKIIVSVLKRVKRNICHGIRIKRMRICCEICGGQGTLTLPHLKDLATRQPPPPPSSYSKHRNSPSHLNGSSTHPHQALSTFCQTQKSNSSRHRNSNSGHPTSRKTSTTSTTARSPHQHNANTSPTQNLDKSLLSHHHISLLGPQINMASA